MVVRRIRPRSERRSDAPEATPDAAAQVAAHWNRQAKAQATARTRWWQFPRVIEHQNRLMCGRPVAGVVGGVAEVLRERRPGGPYPRAVSVGAGNALKEITLLELGVVSHFDVFELAEVRIDQGRQRAEAQGVADRISFHCADAFETDLVEEFDLIYWDNALHHMFDTLAAVRWSRDALRPGGVFFMNDYVGPNRLQWTRRNREVATRVRAGLEPRLLRHPTVEGAQLAIEVEPGRAEAVIERDPSEAADSEAIVAAVRSTFSDAEVRNLGGAIYHAALSDVLANFTEADDGLLDLLLLVDELLAREGETHYAMAVATKS